MHDIAAVLRRRDRSSRSRVLRLSEGRALRRRHHSQAQALDKRKEGKKRGASSPTPTEWMPRIKSGHYDRRVKCCPPLPAFGRGRTPPSPQWGEGEPIADANGMDARIKSGHDDRRVWCASPLSRRSAEAERHPLPDGARASQSPTPEQQFRGGGRRGRSLCRVRGEPPQRRHAEQRPGHKHQEDVLRSGNSDQPGNERDRNDRDREADAIDDRQRRADELGGAKRAFSAENCGESPTR